MVTVWLTLAFLANQRHDPGAMGRGGQIVVVLYVAWLIVFMVLLGSRGVDRDFVSLFGLLPLWGPLLAIAVVSGLVWIERRIRHR